MRTISKMGEQRPPIPGDLFNCGRICKYCGINMDTADLEYLNFFDDVETVLSLIQDKN